MYFEYCHPKPAQTGYHFQQDTKAAEPIRYQWSAYARDPLNKLTARFLSFSLGHLFAVFLQWRF